MRLLVTTEERFWQCAGHTYVLGTSRYGFWRRYLDGFDEVVVLGRAMPVEKVQPDWQQVDGERISVVALPYYLGPWQYLKRYQALRWVIQQNVSLTDALLLRVPSPVSARLMPWLNHTRHPFGLEVIGDPYDVFAPGSVIHPLSPFFRWHFTRHLRRQCAAATAVAYVTSSTLQRRYPTGPQAYTTHYSSIDLPTEAFVPTPRVIAATPTSATIISVMSMAQMYKAPDILIRAVAQRVEAGDDLRLVMIGDGRYLKDMQELTKTLGIGNRVRFTGKLVAGQPIRDELDQADLFILPSRTEGLPRAVIEAMARSLPCIGSTAGGIPELLPAEDMIPPNEVEALSKKISVVLANPDRMNRMSADNLQRSFAYRDEILRARRAAFYREIRTRTEAYIRSRK